MFYTENEERCFHRLSVITTMNIVLDSCKCKSSNNRTIEQLMKSIFFKRTH